MATLTSSIASSGTFIPMLAEDGQTMTGLIIRLNINWSDADGIPNATTTVDFDAWAMLSDDQKVALQGIHDTIGAAVVSQI